MVTITVKSFSHKDITGMISKIASNLSIIRRLEEICEKYQYLIDHIQTWLSSTDAMNKDWYNARVFTVSKFLSGEEILLTQLEPEAYHFLENVWLEDIKRLNAYFIWADTKNTASNPNYFEAVHKIRGLLLTKATAPMTEFNDIKEYIEENYLFEGKFDDIKKEKACQLLAHKAKQLQEVTGNNGEKENWFRAQLFCKLFYENIIPSIVEEDVTKKKESMAAVLKAFEFVKAPNRYSIINAFEAAIPIYFFNKDLLKERLESPEEFDFNMLPIEDWTDISANISNLEYLKDEKELVYTGVMTEAEKAKIKKLLSKEKQKTAIDRLYDQSNQNKQEPVNMLF